MMLECSQRKTVSLRDFTPSLTMFLVIAALLRHRSRRRRNRASLEHQGRLLQVVDLVSGTNYDLLWGDSPLTDEDCLVVQDHNRMSESSYNPYVPRETPDQMSMRSGSPADIPGSRYSSSQHRKRKRDIEEPPRMSHEDQQHMIWSDELLDYFMLQSESDMSIEYPQPPRDMDLNRPIDDKGHTPMHWAAAMGDLISVRDLLHRGARIDSQAHNGETPLMRAVLFTNNHDKLSMDKLVRNLIQTVGLKDYCQSTVFHHTVATTCSKAKYACARYYLETILERMKNSYNPSYIQNLLDAQDQNGDTATLIAARFGARKCVRTLLNLGASIDIPNQEGQTAEDLIAMLNARRRDRHGIDLGVASSSPVRDMGPLNDNHELSHAMDGAVRTPSKRQRVSYRSEAAHLLSSQLPVLIESRTEALAAEFEKEIAEQDAAVTEGTKALELRREEVERLEKECDSAASLTIGNQSGEDESLAEEVRTLEDEVRDLLQTEQLDELGHQVDTATNKAPTPNGVSSPQDQSAITRQVHDAQSRRQQLLQDLTTAISHTGLSGLDILQGAQPTRKIHTDDSQLTAKYLRLIRAALNISVDEDIESVLPEMLRELEEGKREREEVERDAGLADAGSMMETDGLTPPGNGKAGHVGMGYGFGAVEGGRGVGIGA